MKFIFYPGVAGVLFAKWWWWCTRSLRAAITPLRDLKFELTRLCDIIVDGREKIQTIKRPHNFVNSHIHEIEIQSVFLLTISSAYGTGTQLSFCWLFFRNDDWWSTLVILYAVYIAAYKIRI